MDQHRPASGITAIFDSQRPAVRGANCALHVGLLSTARGLCPSILYASTPAQDLARLMAFTS